MRAGMRPLLVALVLTLWVVSGSVGMVFDACLMMGAMCEAPCGLLSYIVAPAVSGLAALQPTTYLASRPAADVSAVAPRPLTPPPKFSLLSA